MMYNNFMPSFSIKTTGQSPEWRSLGIPLTRVNSDWRPCKQVWTRVNGTWSKVFDLEVADPFDGTGSLNNAFTPGQVIWKVYGGSFNKSGGLATAGTLSSIAGIETGTDKNIQLEIDSGNASQAGTGVSFWIQDQSNWWGAQIYYQAYSITTPGTTVFYNLRCANYTYTVTNTPGATTFDVYNITNFSRTSTGISFQYRSRACQGNGRYASSTALEYSGCAGVVFSCSEVAGVPANSPCTAAHWSRNCGGSGSCTTCGPAPSSVTNYVGRSACPSSPATFGSNGCGQGDNAVAAGPGTFPSSTFGDWTGNINSTTNIGCSNPESAPGTCTHTIQPFGPYFNTNFNGSFDSKPTSPFPCPSGSGQTCEAFPSSITNQPTTSFSTFRKARIIRSIGGSVSEIASTNNIPDGTTLGGLMTELTSSQVRVTAYSGAARTGAQPTLIYNIPAGVAKSTKHGILVAGMPAGTYGGAPSFQGYSISRFKATLI